MKREQTATGNGIFGGIDSEINSLLNIWKNEKSFRSKSFAFVAVFSFETFALASLEFETDVFIPLSPPSVVQVENKSERICERRPKETTANLNAEVLLLEMKKKNPY